MTAAISPKRSVANAVVDALNAWGITHLDIPFTAEKVWKAIQAAEANNGTTAAAAD